MEVRIAHHLPVGKHWRSRDADPLKFRRGFVVIVLARPLGNGVVEFVMACSSSFRGRQDWSLCQIRPVDDTCERLPLFESSNAQSQPAIRSPYEG